MWCLVVPGRSVVWDKKHDLWLKGSDSSVHLQKSKIGVCFFSDSNWGVQGFLRSFGTLPNEHYGFLGLSGTTIWGITLLKQSWK